MHIGVFDSGVGGLSVLKQFKKILPEYDYVYLGDNARAPYGDRSPERIYEFTRQGVAWLFDQDCALVILACNSASAEALRRLQQEWLPTAYPDRRILGILIPAVESIIKNHSNKKIGVIGTRATIQSNAYVREFTKRTSVPPSILQHACPLLVVLIEEGWQKTIPSKMIIKKYLAPFKQKKIQVLVLGCTHYSFIKDIVKRIMGKRVECVDPSVVGAQSLKAYLANHGEIESRLSKQKTVRICSTDSSQRIKQLTATFWGAPVDVEKISLESDEK